MVDFRYQPIFEKGEDATEYRSLGSEGVDLREEGGRPVLAVSDDTLARLSREAIHDIQHLLRTSHLEQLRAILDDPEASNNDRYVAYELLRNAAIASGGVLPGCQDTGTAIVMAHRGVDVRTQGDDAEALSRGIFEAYQRGNLRYSQVAPLDMYTERNTGTNLPAQIDVYAGPGNEYHFLFMAKGGGSANKTFLYQETKALLNPASLLAFVEEKIRAIGTSACPPYHLALVIGGTSAEMTLKTVKLASARYLDDLPRAGNAEGRAFRDPELEAQVFDLCRQIGVGAQFGGKYFAHDVRVVRLPRHGASCPVGLGVSCSADRQALAKITPEGVFLERLETDPARFLPDVDPDTFGGQVVHIDLNAPMEQVRESLSRHPVATRVSLNGPLIVARDIAHAKLKERVDRGEGLPEYFRRYPVYYAGPAKTPAGYASGSFGPTTAGRMDPYVDLFQQHGGSLIMLAKGNRSEAVRRSCERHGGFYLGSIGGPAARLAEDCIRKVEVVEYEELGMEAIWRIEVENFPAFIVIDDKGNDFYADLSSRRPIALT